jgi:hypothetical protein
MSGLAQRRARVLRVRQLEHRVASARLATAEAAVANLDRISGRLAALRASLRPATDRTDGVTLKAMAEMAIRLEKAQGDLAAPINAAAHKRALSQAERSYAKSREDGAEKLHGRAVRSETYEQALRADANRPFRKRAPVFGGKS